MGKYDKHFIFQDKPDLKLPEYRHEIPKERGHRIVYLDDEVFPGAGFYVEAVWFWPREVPAHKHPFDEVIAFFSTNPDDVQDLGGEVELWIDGEKNLIDRNFMAFIPAGTEHCPLQIRRIERPMFHFTAGPGKMYE
jgi:mannose-6-phosphate isomerase-like protein (cupin superfamily)